MYPFKISSLQDREAFYTGEFDIEKGEEWFEKHPPAPQLFALDAGTETKIAKDPEKINQIINLDSGISFEKLKEKLIHYLPEDAYYDRNRYKEPQKALAMIQKKDYFNNPNFLGQELAFDMDSDNLKCEQCRNKKFIDFCLNCFNNLKKKVPEAYGLLKEEFKQVEIIYSGRGFHFHIFDKKAYALSLEEREACNERLKGYFMDPWVSRGRIRLIRLPYSLNALVSRIVTPLTLKEVEILDISADERVIPEFLKK